MKQHGSPSVEIDRFLEQFTATLIEQHRTRQTIAQYRWMGRRFLEYLARKAVLIKAAQPADVGRFIKRQLQIYRRNHGRAPQRLVEWRCGWTPAVHALLEELRGGWPPTTALDLQVKEYEAHLRERRFVEEYVRGLCCHARRFLEYLAKRRLELKAVQPSDVAAYLSYAAGQHRKKHWYWMKEHRRSVHYILQYVQGEWPPGSTPSPLLFQFRGHLDRHCCSSSEGT